MIEVFITKELVQKEYPKEYDYFLNILRNSNSRYKDTDEDQISWGYSFSYYKKKSENTPEYYQKLLSLPYNDRFDAELKKVRVSINITAGYFFMSDRVDNISDTIKEIVKNITAQKMINEYEYTQNNDVLDTIPFVVNNEKIKPMSLQEQLKQAIEIEDYIEAARLRDEIKKLEE